MQNRLIRRPVSACAARYHDPAKPWHGMILIAPGTYIHPSRLGSRMAGGVNDLAKVRAFRLAGNYAKARDWLAMAKDVRRFLSE